MISLVFDLLKFCHNHINVNDGIKSVPGRISSMKLKTLPNAPFHPPNIMKNTIADIGAQIKSANSPNTGMLYVA